MPFLSPGRPDGHGKGYTPLPTDALVPEGASKRDLWHEKDAAAVPSIDCCCCWNAAAAENGKRTMYTRWKDGDFTIIPETHIYLDIWDIQVILALMATALLLPYEVALVVTPPTWMFVFDKWIDLTFTCDILLTFNVAFQSGDMQGGSYERAPLKVARYYMAFPLSDNMKAGWFWLDIITVFPWDMCLDTRNSDSVRLVRVLRLIRMFRLVRVIKLFRRWHTTIGFSFALVEIVKVLGSTFLIVHWLSCYWAYLGQRDDVEVMTWMSMRMLADHQTPETSTHLQMYNLALCYVVEIITTVGLGDTGPTNDFEIAITTVSMLATGLVWAWVVATFVNVVETTDVYKGRFNLIMDDLNGVMHTRKIPHSLRYRLRKHLHESFLVHRARHQHHTIQYLSAGLQGEVAIESGMDKVCDCIWYLRNISTQVLIEIAQLINQDMFSPNEFIIDRFAVSVIRKGTCFHKGKVLTRDSCIGMDMILESEGLKENIYPRTVTFVEVYTFTRNSLGVVCAKHPDFSRVIRKAQVRLAVIRGVIFAARAEKLRREQEERETDRSVAEDAVTKSGFDTMLEPGTPLRTPVHRPLPPTDMFTFASPSFIRDDAPPGGCLGGTAKVSNASVDDVLSELRGLNRRFHESHLDVKSRLDRMERRVEKMELALHPRAKEEDKSGNCRSM